jgi:hypothetical protein
MVQVQSRKNPAGLRKQKSCGIAISIHNRKNKASNSFVEDFSILNNHPKIILKIHVKKHFHIDKSNKYREEIVQIDNENSLEWGLE